MVQTPDPLVYRKVLDLYPTVLRNLIKIYRRHKCKTETTEVKHRGAEYRFKDFPPFLRLLSLCCQMGLEVPSSHNCLVLSSGIHADKVPMYIKYMNKSFLKKMYVCIREYYSLTNPILILGWN